MDQKVGFNAHKEAIQNALKWRKPDMSIFISKKVVIFIKKVLSKLKNGKLYFVLYRIITKFAMKSIAIIVKLNCYSCDFRFGQ